jgi:hypothetical protein
MADCRAYLRWRDSGMAERSRAEFFESTIEPSFGLARPTLPSGERAPRVNSRKKKE